ncbi:MAG: hypothetical protein ACK50A_09565 [Sphingobacteriaceae bacterium]
MKQLLNIHTNRSFETACEGQTLRARRVACAQNWSVLIFWVPFVSRQKVMMKIKNFLKQQLNTHTNLNFEAPIVLRSNSEEKLSFLKTNINTSPNLASETAREGPAICARRVASVLNQMALSFWLLF